MQALRRLASLGLLLVVFVAPGQSQEKQPQILDTSYYPLREGSQWLYKVTVDDAPGEKEVLIAVEKKDIYLYKYLLPDKTGKEERIWRFQLRVVSGSKELTDYVAVLQDGVYRFAAANKEITPPLCFLKLPIKKGDAWKVDSTSENMSLTGTFKCDDEGVKVPAGSFPTKHISGQDFLLGTEKMTLEYWFAPNVGIVKERVRVGNSSVVMELKEFKAGK